MIHISLDFKEKVQVIFLGMDKGFDKIPWIDQGYKGRDTALNGPAVKSSPIGAWNLAVFEKGGDLGHKDPNEPAKGQD